MRKPPALLVVFGVSAALFAVLPIGYLVLRLFEGFDRALAELLRLRTLELLGNTILLVTAVSISALLLGFAQAWLTTRSNVKFASMFAVLAALPLAIPSYVMLLDISRSFRISQDFLPRGWFSLWLLAPMCSWGSRRPW